MTTETIDVQQAERDVVVQGERGVLLAMLLMVVLGVAGIFAVSG